MDEQSEYKNVLKFSSPLHQIELEALKMVYDMAKGNLHCPQDEKRRESIKIIENLINNNNK